MPLIFLLSMTSSLFALKSTTGAVNSSTVLFTTVHTNCRHNIMHEKCGQSKVNGLEMKIVVKSGAIEIVFKSWEPFSIYQLISTGNMSKIELNWLCWLAVNPIRIGLYTDPHDLDFFQFFSVKTIHFRYKTFFKHNNSSVATVSYCSYVPTIFS